MTTEGAREALEDAVRAAVDGARKCGTAARPCEDCEDSAREVMTAADALAADEVLKAADMTLGRAREAEGERAALEARVRDLAGSWTGDDGQGPPTTEMLTEAACGKALLGLLGDREAPDA
jgi:hypothetical protein